MKKVLISGIILSSLSVSALENYSWWERLIGSDRIQEGSKLNKTEQEQLSANQTKSANWVAKPEQVALFQELELSRFLQSENMLQPEYPQFAKYETEQFQKAFKEVRKCCKNDIYSTDIATRCGEQIARLDTAHCLLKKAILDHFENMRIRVKERIPKK